MPKISLNLPDTLADQLRQRTDIARGGLSEALREALERHFFLLDIGRKQIWKTFTAGELSLICDVCNGTMFQAMTFIAGIRADVSDSEDLYFEKWGCDRKELLAKLTKLTPLQDAALVDAVERFWNCVANARSMDKPDPGKILD